MRKVIEKDTAWYWEEEQNRSFEELKGPLVTNTPTLKFYDLNMPVTFSVDTNSGGVGTIILQEDKPVANGPRLLTDCQRKYAQLEKELIAIVFVYEKFHNRVYIRETHAESDHKLLESIFKKPLHQAPMSLQRMILRLKKYSFTVTYNPGQELHIADCIALSIQ